MGLVPASELMRDAQARGYAVGHFNLNNLESVRAFLLAAQEARSPVILAVSRGMADYMGGHASVRGLVEPFMRHLKVDVPVSLHVDHGTYEDALSGLEAGFTSVMFDGSALPFEENLRLTLQLVDLCRERGVSLEVEVGAVGGEEDGVEAVGEVADPDECRLMAEAGVDLLAAGIGNVHGRYPPGWQGLRFDVLDEIRAVTGDLPLVLHGGSGVPEVMIKDAIRRGVNKINVNTECQVAFANGVRRYIEEERDLQGKGYAIRDLLADGVEAMKRVAIEKMELFGSAGKA